MPTSYVATHPVCGDIAILAVAAGRSFGPQSKCVILIRAV